MCKGFRTTSSSDPIDSVYIIDSVVLEWWVWVEIRLFAVFDYQLSLTWNIRSRRAIYGYVYSDISIISIR